MKPHLQIGYVSRVHGLKGEVVIKTFDPNSTAVEAVERLHLETRADGVKDLKLRSLGEAPGSDLLVAFEGIHRREAAECLKGAAVFVYREDLDDPAEGEFFYGDLVGLEAFDPSGKRLGVVEEIWDTGPVPNLCIRDGQVELLVPFAEEFVPKIDVAQQRVTVIPLQFDDE